MHRDLFRSPGHRLNILDADFRELGTGIRSGKFAFPDTILLAASRLTDEQWEQVKCHPEDGARIVQRIDGYAPVAEPKFAAAVVVEHGGGGSAVAAPIARDLLIEVQKRARERPLPGARLAEATRERAGEPGAGR